MTHQADSSSESGMNFHIQDTFEQQGSMQLVNDLLEPETATASPAEVSAIETPIDSPLPPSKDGKPEDTKESQPPAAAADILSSLSGEDPEDDSSTNEPATSPENPSAEEGSSDLFSSLAEELFNQGLFTPLEDDEDLEIKTGEDLLNRFRLEKQKGANEIIENILSQHGEDYKHAFEAIYMNGVSPKEYFQVYNEIVDFAQLDLTQESNQEKVMRRALADQGFDQDDINTEIERLKNYGDLEMVSQKHQKVIIKKDAEKLEQKKQESAMRLQEKAALKDQYINNVQTILSEKIKAKEFDGIPVNPKIASDLHNYLIVDKWKTPSGEILTDFDKDILDLKKPENHALKVKYALLLNLMKTDPTLSSIQKTAISKKTDVLFEKVAKQVKRDKNPEPSKVNLNPWFVNK